MICVAIVLIIVFQLHKYILFKTIFFWRKTAFTMLVLCAENLCTFPAPKILSRKAPESISQAQTDNYFQTLLPDGKLMYLEKEIQQASQQNYNVKLRIQKNVHTIQQDTIKKPTSQREVCLIFTLSRTQECESRMQLECG